MKILFIADPVAKLNPKGDSTLVMLRAALKRKHTCEWAEDSHLGLVNNIPMILSQKVSWTTDEPLPALQAPEIKKLTQFDAILIRKDPPFNENYLKLCWLAELCETQTLFVNAPSVLLKFHEKLIPLQAFHEGYLKSSDLISTFLTHKSQADTHFNSKNIDDIITKPFLGFGGRDISRWNLMNWQQGHNHPHELIQPFDRNVTEGDRRVFFLDGKLLTSVVRVPKPGGYISNLAQGGSAVMKPLSPAEKAVAARLGKFLKAKKIILAGADFIGAKVSEVNVTSPTGLANILALENHNYGENIIAWIEKKA